MDTVKKENRDNFRAWLISSKMMGEKSARDVLSRCGRVEKVIKVSLETAAQTETGIQKVLDTLSTKSSSYLSPKTNAVYAVAVLKRAVRLYYEYKMLKKP